MQLSTERIREFDDWLIAQGRSFGALGHGAAHEQYHNAALALVEWHPTASGIEAARWYWYKAYDEHWATFHAPTHEEISAAATLWRARQEKVQP